MVNMVKIPGKEIKMDFCPKCNTHTASYANTGMICSVCHERYRAPKIDLTVPYREVTKTVCEFCGMKKPITVMMNPNVFPANDDNKPEDYWDVCGTCRDYINATIVKDHANLIDDFMRRWERTHKEGEQQ